MPCAGLHIVDILYSVVPQTLKCNVLLYIWIYTYVVLCTQSSTIILYFKCYRCYNLYGDVDECVYITPQLEKISRSARRLLSGGYEGGRGYAELQCN